MKRSLLAVVTAVILSLMLTFGAAAATVPLADTAKTVTEYGDWLIEKIDGDTRWELDTYRGSDAEIIPPRIIEDMIVISFGHHCFANNTTVKSVITSSPLWIVGDYAFNGCTALERFECNYALHTIGVGAFAGAASLTDINLEESVVTEISDYAFADSGLTQVTLPATCTTIGDCAFLRCSALEKITIPDSVTEIADNAFEECDSLVIYCNTDSYAHEYAEANGIGYVLLDAPVEVTFILGDADGDGKVTIIDATKIQRVLVDLDSDDDGMIALRGIVDGEDELNIMHATKIQRFLADFAVAVPIGEEVTKTVQPSVNES